MSKGLLWFFPVKRRVTTDASLWGWGTHWDQNLAQGIWSQAEGAIFSNWRELRAVALALADFSQDFHEYHVQFFSGNATKVAYLNKWGHKKQGPSVTVSKSPTVGGKSAFLVNGPSQRHTKWGGRLFEQMENSGSRVEPESRDFCTDHQDVGASTGGLVCIKRKRTSLP